MNIKERLRELENESRLLEPSPQDRKDAQQRVIDYSEQFLNAIETTKTFNLVKDDGSAADSLRIQEDAVGLDEALRVIAEKVDFPGLNPASGGHLAYIPGGGIYYSALADYLADVTNRYAGVFYAGPGAVRMENMLLRWMCDLVGYPAGSAGNLTTSGSLANLIATVVARDAKNIRS